MVRSYFITLFVFLIFTGKSQAQGSFDLIALDLKKQTGKWKLDLNSVEKITDRDLYDNQPSFINDKQMAFSAADDKGNHDIIIFNFESRKFTNLTKTADRNEFSPSLTDCGLYVSAVTVAPDGKQRLWLYPTNFGEPELLYDDIEPVGYYDWYDNKAAMFVLGKPNTLVYPYSKSELYTIHKNIGRSIKKQPKSSIITYLDLSQMDETDGQKAFRLMGFDIEKREYMDLGMSLPGSQDFIWLDANTLLMGRGNELFVRKIGKQNWELLGKIELDGYQNISRLAYSDPLKKLVVVMERKKE
jgi:hypothetical protein